MSPRALLPVALGVTLASCATQPACDDRCRANAEKNGLPVPVYRKAPEYPREAVNRGVSGCTVVSFVIRPDGLADEFQVLDSKPAGVFDGVTLLALKDWRFEVPARPGRYAQRLDYLVQEGHGGSTTRPPCIEAPGYDALNPPEGGK